MINWCCPLCGELLAEPERQAAMPTGTRMYGMGFRKEPIVVDGRLRWQTIEVHDGPGACVRWVARCHTCKKTFVVVPPTHESTTTSSQSYFDRGKRIAPKDVCP